MLKLCVAMSLKQSKRLWNIVKGRSYNKNRGKEISFVIISDGLNKEL